MEEKTLNWTFFKNLDKYAKICEKTTKMSSLGYETDLWLT